MTEADKYLQERFENYECNKGGYTYGLDAAMDRLRDETFQIATNRIVKDWKRIAKQYHQHRIEGITESVGIECAEREDSFDPWDAGFIKGTEWALEQLK